MFGRRIFSLKISILEMNIVGIFGNDAQRHRLLKLYHTKNGMMVQLKQFYAG